MKNTLKEKYIDTILKSVYTENNHDFWRKYFNSAIDNVFEFDGGKMMAIDKPKMQTRFPFGYSSCGQGMEYDECIELANDARENIASYFKQENLHNLDELIEKCNQFIGENTSNSCGYSIFFVKRPCYIHYSGCENIWSIQWMHLCEYNQGCLPRMQVCTVEDVIKYRDALKLAQERFEKRLDAYLKRYDTKNLSVYTYWIDD